MEIERIQLLIELVGGPLDGNNYVFNGEKLFGEWRERLATLVINGHTYRLIELDEEKHEAKFQY